MVKITRPKFNLRGHTAGVTALCHGRAGGEQFLISGDQEGTLASWNLTTFRRINIFHKVCISRVQSLRVIRLNFDSRDCGILLAQSRDHGVNFFDLAKVIGANSDKITALKNIPTYTALFSRGDAINSTTSEAIAAYPSSLESHLIAVRYLGNNLETKVSGTAQRDQANSRRTCSVFDIRLHKAYGRPDNHLFAGYEDGGICCFSFNADSTTTIPELGTTGLKIDLIFKCDTGFQDFISAYDLIERRSRYIIICGAPKKELVRIMCDKNFGDKPVIDRINIKKQGVGAIAVSPDHKTFASAGWDNIVSLYGLEDLQLRESHTHHLNQVQDIIFIAISKQPLEDADNMEDPNETSISSYMCSASLDGTISISLHETDR